MSKDELDTLKNMDQERRAKVKAFLDREDATLDEAVQLLVEVNMICNTYFGFLLKENPCVS